MSTSRATAGSIASRFPLKNGGCAWCGGELPKGLRRYCSEACSDEIYVRTHPSFARWKVAERDNGVCALCSRDTNALQRALNKAGTSDPWAPGYQRSSLRRRVVGALRDQREWAGFGRFTTHLWEMDHTVPVVEGGGECGLENLRTLCVPCHKAETRELARRRAATRRGQGDLFLVAEAVA